MPSVREIAQEIVAREGGFVNDPDDPGGATKHGVTIHTMRRLGIDLDGDGDIDVQDVRRVSTRLATDIFIQHYFEAPSIHELPGPLQPTVFDMYVNAGDNAVKILQRLVGKINEMPIATDGVIGPNTIDATVRAARALGAERLAHAYSIERRNYYYRLADARPTLRKFAQTRAGTKGGWIKRAEDFLPADLHLTQADHARRTARWS